MKPHEKTERDEDTLAQRAHNTAGELVALLDEYGADTTEMYLKVGPHIGPLKTAEPAPGITAQEAARRFGYSRQGARERLERGVEADLLGKRQERRAGKWVVVYAPTEEAAAYMQQKALPEPKETTDSAGSAK